MGIECPWSSVVGRPLSGRPCQPEPENVGWLGRGQTQWEGLVAAWSTGGVCCCCLGVPLLRASTLHLTSLATKVALRLPEHGGSAADTVLSRSRYVEGGMSALYHRRLVIKRTRPVAQFGHTTDDDQDDGSMAELQAVDGHSTPVCDDGMLYRPSSRCSTYLTFLQCGM